MVQTPHTFHNMDCWGLAADILDVELTTFLIILTKYLIRRHLRGEGLIWGYRERVQSIIGDVGESKEQNQKGG